MLNLQLLSSTFVWSRGLFTKVLKTLQYLFYASLFVTTTIILCPSLTHFSFLKYLTNKENVCDNVKKKRKMYVMENRSEQRVWIRDFEHYQIGWEGGGKSWNTMQLSRVTLRATFIRGCSDLLCGSWMLGHEANLVSKGTVLRDALEGVSSFFSRVFWG